MEAIEVLGFHGLPRNQCYLCEYTIQAARKRELATVCSISNCSAFCPCYCPEKVNKKCLNGLYDDLDLLRMSYIQLIGAFSKREIKKGKLTNSRKLLVDAIKQIAELPVIEREDSQEK